MWDYNIGLVRTTALFKCAGYSKVWTAAAHVLWKTADVVQDNPGEDAQQESRAP